MQCFEHVCLQRHEDDDVVLQHALYGWVYSRAALACLVRMQHPYIASVAFTPPLLGHRNGQQGGDSQVGSLLLQPQQPQPARGGVTMPQVCKRLMIASCFLTFYLLIGCCLKHD
jgi:hypothetical protein